ncbi:MAG: VOC family protein [Mobilicoccus sp.]|nr:VOC family protein [Mobilicoccus sp.]
MVTPITPCLWFDGNALEAAEFYVSVFPDSRVSAVQYVQEGHPAGLEAGTVLCVSFELEGRPYFGLNGGPGFPFTQAVSFQTFQETQEDLDRVWDALVDGGQPMQCSWLVDRYGLNWQVVPEAYREAMHTGGDAAERAHQALLTMVKPDVAEVKRAIAGP